MPLSNLEERISKLEKPLSAFSQELRLALQYIQPDAGSSLTKSRLILEKLLIGLFITEMGHEPRKPMLKEMLQDNQFTRKIERRILSRMNAIRDMGNLGPHGEAVEPDDAVRVLADLCEVLEWYVRRYVENTLISQKAIDSSNTGVGDHTNKSIAEQFVAKSMAVPANPQIELTNEQSTPKQVNSSRSSSVWTWIKTQRYWIVLLLLTGLILSSIAVVMLLNNKRQDPLVEMKRKEIEREVSLLKSQPPTVLSQQGNDYKEVESFEPIDYSPYQILSDDRVVDLRQWKEVPLDKLHEPYGSITNIRRIRIKKIKVASEIAFEGRTSGLEMYWQCFSKLPYHVIGLKAAVFVGQERMKARRIVIDISSMAVGEEFELRIGATFWNSMQTELEQWFGLIGYEGAFKASQLLLFPNEKPFTKFSMMSARTDRDQSVPYDGPKILLSGELRDWVYWEVPSPEAGRVYKIHWTW